jgi:hypothetical protein
MLTTRLKGFTIKEIIKEGVNGAEANSLYTSGSIRGRNYLIGQLGIGFQGKCCSTGAIVCHIHELPH